MLQGRAQTVGDAIEEIAGGSIEGVVDAEWLMKGYSEMHAIRDAGERVTVEAETRDVTR